MRRDGAILAPSLAIGRCARHYARIEKKFIVHGIDAMDASTDEFRRMAATVPPQSPVARPTFSTGIDPGRHGSFDFVHRDPTKIQPISPMAGIVLPAHNLRFAPYELPQWSEGIKRFSSPGTPGVRGTFGTCTEFHDDRFATARYGSGGRELPVTAEHSLDPRANSDRARPQVGRHVSRLWEEAQPGVPLRRVTSPTNVDPGSPELHLHAPIIRRRIARGDWLILHAGHCGRPGGTASGRADARGESGVHQGSDVLWGAHEDESLKTYRRHESEIGRVVLRYARAGQRGVFRANRTRDVYHGSALNAAPESVVGWADGYRRDAVRRHGLPSDVLKRRQ